MNDKMKMTSEMNKLKAKSLQYIRPREEEETKVERNDERGMF
jgi:hypothetical protein